MIVTANLSDFPASALDRWGIQARHPDQFLMDQFHLDPVTVHKAVQAIADSWTAPPGTANDVLDALDRSGIVETAAVLRR